MRKLTLLLFFTQFVLSQKFQLPIIPDDLIQNSNSIIIDDQSSMEIEILEKVVFKKKCTVLVKNAEGFKHLDFVFQNSKSHKLNSVKIKVYNDVGEQIKSFSKGDFKDHSVSDGFSVFIDDRILFLDYKPQSYPLVFYIESEESSRNTSFLRSWVKYNHFFQAIIASRFTVINKTSSKLNILESNFENQEVEVQKAENHVVYSTKNVLSLKTEPNAKYDSYIPKAEFSLSKAYLEGVELDFENWNRFGKTFYDNFLKDNSAISPILKSKLDKIILASDSKEEKIKKIYQFVQGTTRYISIQEGIGGWKPMLVEDVEKYNYGDCKALSNYTRSILNAYGIESYYTRIYAGDKISKINESFPLMQFNHVILAIPFGNEYKFLECTSQTNPYAFLGDFTSNRKALVIKPEGGEIVSTTQYTTDLNKQITKAVFVLKPDGHITGKVDKKSQYWQYNHVYELEREKNEEIIKMYKEKLGYLLNAKFEKIKFQNHRDQFEFVEQFELKSDNYMSAQDNLMFIQPNVLNRVSSIPAKVRARKFDFEVDYGYVDMDEIEIEIPQGYKVAGLPQAIKLSEEFGIYEADFQFQTNKIIYKRIYKLIEGVYKKEAYESYRKFKEQVAKNDAIKVELIKS